MTTRILSFERELAETLDFVPLGVRRKLDLAAVKISLDAWRKLAIDDRRALRDAIVTDAASASAFAESVRAAASRASVETEPLPLPALPAWRSDGVPGAIETRLGELGASLDAAAWRALDDEARYLLLALAGKRREPERFELAVKEILGALPVDPRARQ